MAAITPARTEAEAKVRIPLVTIACVPGSDSAGCTDDGSPWSDYGTLETFEDETGVLWFAVNLWGDPQEWLCWWRQDEVISITVVDPWRQA